MVFFNKRISQPGKKTGDEKLAIDFDQNHTLYISINKKTSLFDSLIWKEKPRCIGTKKWKNFLF